MVSKRNRKLGGKASGVDRRKHNLALQKADEKVSIAIQTYDLVNKSVKDLD